MRGKILVVDACIARSAGETVHPVSTNCRLALMAISGNEFRIHMGPELLAEWQRHMGRFARTWLKEMIARRRIVSVSTPCPDDIEPAVRRRVQDANVLAAVLKDLHLICAAIKSDGVVISCDDKVRGYLARAAADVAVIGAVMWENPNERPAETEGWLKRGAPLDHAKRLGNYAAA